MIAPSAPGLPLAAPPGSNKACKECKPLQAGVLRWPKEEQKRAQSARKVLEKNANRIRTKCNRALEAKAPGAASGGLTAQAKAARALGGRVAGGLGLGACGF